MRNQIKLGTSLFITSKPSKIKIIQGTMGTICLICNQNSSKPTIRKKKRFGKGDCPSHKKTVSHDNSKLTKTKPSDKVKIAYQLLDHIHQQSYNKNKNHPLTIK